MTFPIDVEDDGTPRAALDVAGRGVRAFNHRSLGHMDINRDGWRFAPDAYSALGELGYLAAVLPQALQQIIGALHHELELNLIAIDRGSTYDGDPGAAVDAASIALERGTQAAQQLHRAVTDAQNALTAAAYAGPASDLHDDPPRVAVWTAPFPAGHRHATGLGGWCQTAVPDFGSAAGLGFVA